MAGIVAAGGDRERPAFHYLVRAVITSDGRVLVARQRGAANTFLPGGHVEPGEPAKVALRREIEEETGLAAVVGDFLGAVESAWDDGYPQAEINLVFAATLPDVDASTEIVAREDHLEFVWVPPADVARWNLLPEPLREVVSRREPAAAFWGTTMEPQNRDVHRAVALLLQDLHSTVGARCDHLVHRNVALIREYGSDWEAAVFLQKLVDDTQQNLHDMFIDTDWPRCPRHTHPLWLHDEAWWCEKDNLRVAELGKLGNTKRDTP